VVKLVFSQSKLRKNPFFAKTFKIQRGQGPPDPLSDARESVLVEPKLSIFFLKCFLFLHFGYQKCFINSYTA